MDYVLNAVYSSSTLLLLALGLAIVFGLMGVINLAHGEFIMLGAYCAVLSYQVLGTFWLGPILAAVLLGVVGALVERTVVRRLLSRPLETIVVTFGLAIVLREIVKLVAGPDYRSVPEPFGGSVSLFGATYPSYRVFLIAVTLLLVLSVALVQQATRAGLVARGVMENAELASALGTDVNRVYSGTFIVGAALAGVAGALIAPTVNVFPDMGGPYVVVPFLAVLVGGLGSLRGLLIAALLLGTCQYGLSQLWGPVAGLLGVVLLAVACMRALPEVAISRRAA